MEDSEKPQQKTPIKLDVDDVSDRWEVGIQPPPLDEMVKNSRFDPRWIKYMYTRFKNECPSGRMREPEFRRLLSSIIASEKATDQYISRLFHAFSSNDQKTITFQNLVECLSLIHPQTAETNAQWTVRLITGSEENSFAFPFLSFTQSVFGLNEGKREFQELNKETVHQRASTIFRELDCNDDGHVTIEDMVRFFKAFERTTMKKASSSQMKLSNSLSSFREY
uniref:EF-hand domain-containing protein n=1 Tax=Heterorhabditis bacteriophora TaxID=37862 RepID=A0A1I7WAR7_HETBA